MDPRCPLPRILEVMLQIFLKTIVSSKLQKFVNLLIFLVVIGQALDWAECKSGVCSALLRKEESGGRWAWG